MSSVVVIIPVGPGHETVVEEAIASVRAARDYSSGGFDIGIVVEYDNVEPRGRSRARNEAALRNDSEWLLFHDADDLIEPDCFETLRAWRDRDLVWGELHKERRYTDSQGQTLRIDLIKCEEMATPITTWGGMLEGGPLAGARHAFIRRSLFEEIGGWFEPMDIGEDLELVWAGAAHADSFVKVAKPICRTRLFIPAAGGPRGYDRKVQSPTPAWSNPGYMVFGYWQARGRVPWTESERSLRADGVNFYRLPLGEGIQ